MRTIHMTDSRGRSARTAFAPVKPKSRAGLGTKDGVPLESRTFIISTEEVEARLLEHEELADALINGDPEIDYEAVGRTVGPTKRVYLSGGEVMFSAPRFIETVLSPDGEVIDRREPEDTLSNINTINPLRWTGMRVGRAEAARKYVFRHTVQIRHVNGLTYDYLHDMASQLASADQVVYLAAGPEGKDPLVFSSNGSTFHGFLEGRVRGREYQLLLHLSDMELRTTQGEHHHGSNQLDAGQRK